jgi:phosphatidylglycerophosphatase A
MKKAPFLPVLIGTGFGSGFSPFAPGTAGALLASIIWIALYLLLPFSVVLWITAALVIVFTFAGIWAADKLEACWGEDPSRVVVDEMVGVWIPLLAVPNAISSISLSRRASKSRPEFQVPMEVSVKSSSLLG